MTLLINAFLRSKYFTQFYKKDLAGYAALIYSSSKSSEQISRLLVMYLRTFLSFSVYLHSFKNTRGIVFILLRNKIT